MTDVLKLIVASSGSEVVAATYSQVVASMALQRGWVVYSNLPVLHSTSEFLNWAEENEP